jgi:DMSO/TMAO reductase YedYZ heme-binding membrane subunit
MVRYIALFIALYTYAAIRYHIGQELEIDQFFFVLNKAVSWTAFMLLSTSILSQQTLSAFKLTRRSLGTAGYLLAICHIVFSIALLCYEKYPKFLNDGALNFLGWGIVLIGLISFSLFSIPFALSVQKRSKSKYFKLAKWGVLLILFHPLLIGWSGWFAPSKWPLYMPPITLLSVVYALFIWSLRLSSAKETSSL